MKLEIERFLEHIDEWKFKLHEKLKGMSRARRKAFWNEVHEKARARGLNVVEPETSAKQHAKRVEPTGQEELTRNTRCAMQIPVLIEQIAGNGYRARGGEPLAFTADGASQDEALAKLKEKLQARLSNGAVVVPLELAAQSHPLAEFAGMFKDDPLLKEWKKSMAAYRRKVDKDANKP
jgi:hypothetical protein